MWHLRRQNGFPPYIPEWGDTPNIIAPQRQQTHEGRTAIAKAAEPFTQPNARLIDYVNGYVNDVTVS